MGGRALLRVRGLVRHPAGDAADSDDLWQVGARVFTIAVVHPLSPISIFYAMGCPGAGIDGVDGWGEGMSMSGAGGSSSGGGLVGCPGCGTGGCSAGGTVGWTGGSTGTFGLLVSGP